MRAEDIRDGDIVEIDYIAEFTKEHINEGKALVLWKSFNHQPLIMRLDREDYCPMWSCYEYISKVVGHIPIWEILKDKAESEDKYTLCDYDQGHCDGLQVGYELAMQKLDKIKAEIDVARFFDKDTKLCRNANASGLEVAMQIIDKYRGSGVEE